MIWTEGQWKEGFLAFSLGTSNGVLIYKQNCDTTITQNGKLGLGLCCNRGEVMLAIALWC